MAKKKTDLRALALAKMSGFRHKTVTVPEWDGAEVLLREPSAEAWLRWQELVGNEDELSTSEKAHRNLRCDATLFIDVILDTDEQPVFTPDDIEEVTGIYGPVHSRLLKQALDLITSADTAKEK